MIGSPIGHLRWDSMRTGVPIAHSVCGVPKPYSRLTTVKLVGNWWGLHGCSIWEHSLVSTKMGSKPN